MSDKLGPETDTGYAGQAMDDDPLAELARIVAGEDVRQEEPSAMEVEAEQEDFALSLEAELMNELAGDEDTPNLDDFPSGSLAPEALPLQEPPAAHEFADAVEAEVQPAQSPSGSEDPFADELMQVLNDELDPHETPAETGSTHSELDTELDFEAALAAEIVAENQSGTDGQPVNPEDALPEPHALTAEVEAFSQQEEPELSQMTETVVTHDASELDALMELEPADHVAYQQAQTSAPGSAYDPELDLGAAFTSEFEQLAERSEANSGDHINADFEAATAALRGDFHEEQEAYVGERPAEHESSSEDSMDFESEFGQAFAEELGQVDPASDPFQESTSEEEFMAAIAESNASMPHDPGYVSAPEEFSEPETKKRPIAAIALAGALLAGLVVAAYSFWMPGDEPTGGEPVIIKADEGPVKVKPEDPGGRVVANRDKASYEKVDGTDEQASSQESLITTTEEPVQLSNSTTETAALDEKSDERLAADTGNEVNEPEVTGIAPRKVKTVTVKPDGTILQGGASAENDSSALSLQSSISDANGEATPSADVNVEVVAVAPEPIDGAKATGLTAVPTASPLPKPEPQPVAPAAAPVPKPQPQTSDDTQPIQLASSQASQQQPATTPVRSSEWVVQVSSQRSAEAAQSSYNNLRSRFPGIFDGRSMSIQRAAVEGKGTFFRVRIQTASRSDANEFCGRLKGAGGSCFVTR